MKKQFVKLYFHDLMDGVDIDINNDIKKYESKYHIVNITPLADGQHVLVLWEEN